MLNKLHYVNTFLSIITHGSSQVFKDQDYQTEKNILFIFKLGIPDPIFTRKSKFQILGGGGRGGVKERTNVRSRF